MVFDKNGVFCKVFLMFIFERERERAGREQAGEGEEQRERETEDLKRACTDSQEPNGGP